jgi:flagellar basal-body rod protein FlgC
MDLSQTFAISAAGMQVERVRVETAALNLANANTVQVAGKAPYQPLRVVATTPADSAASTSFAGMVAVGMDNAASMLPALLPVVTVLPAGTPPRLVHEPGHPLADAQGWVRYAGVDTATEMMTLMSGSRAYEANVAAMNTSKNLALKTLDIGGANA